MSTNTPTVQRAWRIVRQGDPAKALILDTNVPVPKQIPKGEVLIKIQAAALNPVGYKFMRHAPNTMFKRIAEHDFAGEVVDPNGSDFKVGENIYGMIEIPHSWSTRQGSLTSYISSRPYPAGLTAYQALFDLGKLEKGQTIFINGGSTSVGAFAIQLAKAKGCKVVASASGKNEQFVKDLGADEFIDYTAAPLHENLSKNPPNPKYSVFLEAVGLNDPALYIHSEKYLAPNGIFISVGPYPLNVSSVFNSLWHYFLRPSWVGGTKRSFRIVTITVKKAEHEAFTKLVKEGKVKPVVDSVFKFYDALQAYDKLLTSRAKGKIVIEIAD